MTRPASRLLVAALLAVAARPAAAGGRRDASPRGADRAGGGGELTLRDRRRPAALDPLARRTPPSRQLVIRQLFEPLVASLRQPYGGGRDRRGLALGWQPSRDFRVWAFGCAAASSSRTASRSTPARSPPTPSAGAAILPAGAAAGPDRRRCPAAGPRADDLLPAPAAAALASSTDPRLGIVSPLAIESLGGLPSGPGAGRAASAPAPSRSARAATKGADVPLPPLVGQPDRPRPGARPRRLHRDRE